MGVIKKNRFDERYDIRFAKYEEIEEIMQFLDTYWKKGHILATNRQFFEYEMVVDGRVNFIIAKDRATGNIHGLDGFMCASKNVEKLDIWGSMWKVIPGAMGMLGMEIDRRLKEYTKCRNCLVIGGNPNTTIALIKKMLKYENIGKMQHFYCLSNRKKYHIAKVEHYEKFVENKGDIVDVVRIKDIHELEELYVISSNDNVVPYKDLWYINHRYFEHPIYEYQVYGLLNDDNKAEALFVCREQEYDGCKALRIIDYIGKQELFSGISNFLKTGLEKYEYIDMYCYGFDVSLILQAGMIELREDDTNIIPNYFAPYVAENIDIWVGSPKENTVFFKADGDQDRPN